MIAIEIHFNFYTDSFIRFKFNITVNACSKAHFFLMHILRLYIEFMHQKSMLLYASVYGIKQRKKNSIILWKNLKKRKNSL